MKPDFFSDSEKPLLDDDDIRPDMQEIEVDEMDEPSIDDELDFRHE